jgi:hypothetical protein
MSDHFEALMDEADRTRKETIKCDACGQLVDRDDEDHEATDCVGCDRTIRRCMAKEHGELYPLCSSCYENQEDAAWGDHIDEEIDRIKEARSEGH